MICLADNEDDTVDNDNERNNVICLFLAGDNMYLAIVLMMTTLVNLIHTI